MRLVTQWSRGHTMNILSNRELAILAIEKNPADIQPRLVYADIIEEDEPVLAEAIRSQLRGQPIDIAKIRERLGGRVMSFVFHKGFLRCVRIWSIVAWLQIGPRMVREHPFIKFVEVVSQPLSGERELMPYGSYAKIYPYLTKDIEGVMDGDVPVRIYATQDDMQSDLSNALILWAHDQPVT